MSIPEQSYNRKHSYLRFIFGTWVHRRVFCDSIRMDPVFKKGKRKVQGVPQSQTAALPRPHEEEETDKFKQVQTEQTYEKH